MAIGVNRLYRATLEAFAGLPGHCPNSSWVKLLATGRPRAYINARSDG